MAIRKEKNINKLAKTQALAGYGPMWLILFSGFLAGASVVILPLAILAFNTVVQFFLGTVSGVGSEWGIYSAKRLLIRSTPGLIGGALVMGILGSALAALRRISIRRELYFGGGGERGRIDLQMGLNTIVSLVAGPLITIIILNALDFGLLFYFFGIGGFFLGAMFDMYWEGVQEKVMHALGKPDPGAERAIEIRELLRSDESLGKFTPRWVSVDFEQRSVLVEGDYSRQDALDMEKRVRDLVLTRVIGMKRVLVRPVSVDSGTEQALQEAMGAASTAAIKTASPIEGFDMSKAFRIEVRSRLKTA